jgi:DUF1009 family protein
VERSLALMAGAGVLPGRAAAEAKRQGWRVLAFAFDEAPGLAAEADRTMDCDLGDLQSVLATLAMQRPAAALFVGKFWKQRVFEHAERADVVGHHLAQGGASDDALARMAVLALEAMDIDVLDQRRFLEPAMAVPGVLTARVPSEAEWAEIRGGFTLARQLASHGIGQTIVRRLGATVAVEGAEGTDETIRRGTRLAGPGAVVVKAVAASHDYRFDVPAVGPATLDAMIEGGAAVLAVDGGKVLLVDREELLRRAEDAKIAIVAVESSVGSDG